MPLRPRDIPPDRVAALNTGAAQSRNLAEHLATDLAALLTAALGPHIASHDLARGATLLRQARAQGITRRMALAASFVHDHVRSPEALRALATHPSDTVRAWACAAAQLDPSLTLDRRLGLAQPFAADGHFGVREWAWMAVRPMIAADPLPVIRLLAPWALHADPNLRRFASEATRPRGVWCAHIPALKLDPSPGLAILEPLRDDPHTYVQDSVANWLNDASKTAEGFVRRLAARWLGGGATPCPPATARIVRRGTRSLGKPAQ